MNGNSTNVLIISDREDISEGITHILGSEGFNVYTANNGNTGINIAKKVPIHLLITGMVMPGMFGNEIIKNIKSIDENTVVWVITEEKNFNLDFVIQAMKLGADDYFVVIKGLPMEKMLKSLKAFKEKINLLRENKMLLEKLSNGRVIDTLLGNCEEIRNIHTLVQKVAPTSAPILITGESGTGKEVVARTIWELSDRKDKPYVPINCGAIPESLLESELYGHEKGSFTGAHTTKIGKLEAANGGTVLLDEIGEMPLSLQVKLLRFLEEGEIQRIGGNQPIKLDVRILSATNKNIEKEIEHGRFRDDLYYRLNVIHIHMPPLRDRGIDILMLANYFLRTLSNKEGRKDIKGFSSLALTRMQEYHWPGNIRELKHKIHRAVILATGENITAEELGLEEKKGRQSLSDAKNEFVLRYITDALIACNGNITRAAKLLGVARQQLQRYIRKHGINPKVYQMAK